MPVGLRGAAHDEVLAPVRGRGGVAVHLRLLGEGIAEQQAEAIDLGKVFLLRRHLNGRVGEIVAEHVLGIDPPHPRRPLCLSTPFVAAPLGPETSLVSLGPLVEGLPVHEITSDRLVPFLRRLLEVAEGTEDGGYVGSCFPPLVLEAAEERTRPGYTL